MLYIDFDNLCDDIVERILLHVDLASLINFTNGTCRSLRRRLTTATTTGSSSSSSSSNGIIPTTSDEGAAPPVGGSTSCNTNNGTMLLWRTVFERHNFAPSPPPPPSSMPLPPIITIDYQREIQYRLALWNNLCGTRATRTTTTKRRKKMRIQTSSLSLLSSSDEERTTRGRRQQRKYCFSLPTSSFKFKPLLPPNMLHYPPTNNYEANTTTTTTREANNVDHDEDDGSIMDEDNIDTTTTTNNNVDFVDNDIIPTVEFACDSYALTSPSIGTGYVLLDPFSGSISMYENILDNVILHDETLLEQSLLNEMRKADDFIRTFADEEEEEKERSSNSSSSSNSSGSGTRYDTPPIQTLFSVDDYFNMNLEEYFGQYTPFCPSSSSHHHHNVVSSFNGNNNILQNGEATVDWVGVDTHIGLSDDGGTTNNIVGKMVGAVRTVTMESSTNNRTHHHHHMVRNGAGGYEPVVTEILAWSDNNNNNIVGDNNLSKMTSYDIKYVCRVAGEAYFVDICATNCKVYAAFQEKTSGFCPFRMRDGDTSNHAAGSRQQQQLMDIDDELVGNNDGESIHMSKNIYCLPLIRQYDDDTATPVKPETITSYFPMPDASITAQYAVSSFAVESTGRTLLIGTTCGTVEVWHTGMLTMSAPAPARIQIHSVHESFILRHRAMTMDAAAAARRKGGNRKCEEQNSITTKSNDGTTEATLDDLAVLDRRGSTILSHHQEFPHKHPTSKISQFYIPRHLPVQRCGFVTRQKSPQYGTTLLLWQTKANDDNFHITSMINLPLLVQCHPAIHYDGRRLIVFGMDHIGLIILVYHVLGTRYDQNEFNDNETTTTSSTTSANRTRTTTVGKGGEESGGVVQLTSERTVRFVNRIRHAGLGGLEYFDSILMTVNERFVIVNTKTGNLIGSGVGAARNATEGLLVIDLLEQSH